MSDDPRRQAYARSALRKACQELIKLKSGRALATKAKAAVMGSMPGWIPEEEIYRELLRVSAANGLLAKDGEISVRAKIRDGLEIGAQRQLSKAEAENLTNITNQRSAAVACTLRWRATRKEHYRDYMRGYMAHWRMKRRLATQR